MLVIKSPILVSVAAYKTSAMALAVIAIVPAMPTQHMTHYAKMKTI